MTDASSLARLRPGDHACLIVDDDTTRVNNVATYIRAGLRADHRVLYYGNDGEFVNARLAVQGVDTPTALATGQLQMSTPESTYLASGAFDPEATIEGWRTESDRALADGYRGLRAVGEMSWASRPVRGAERLEWYEAQANRVFADGFAMALCVYDRRLFNEFNLARVGWSHPATLETQADMDSVPLLHAVRTGAPPGLRLEGEVDLSNRQALLTLMEHLVDDTPAAGQPLTLDVSGLRFADMAAVQILIRAAVEHHRLRIVGCSPALQRLLTYGGADTVAGLSIEVAA
jgi:anti-anti-sigma regulatory factor